MSTMTRLFAAFALVAAFASAGALAADPPAEAKPPQHQATLRSGFCLLNTQRCSDIAQAPARFCRLGAQGCARDGTFMRVTPPKAPLPALSAPAK
jgi:hypothetical protein